MRGQFREETRTIEIALRNFSKSVRRLEGVQADANLRAFADQIVSSLRRIAYVRHLTSREISPRRADPIDAIFDPLMAACLANRTGNIDEAWWLTFLATHFGKHLVDGWRLTRDFYGAFGTRQPWYWSAVSPDAAPIFSWLDTDWPALLDDGIPRRFSNHRKYESKSPEQMKRVLGSYIDFVQDLGGHRNLMVDVHQTVGQNPYDAFDELYRRMGSVKRFGRLGTFDFLTMLGKLDIAPIEPGQAYLANATGPLAGAKLLVSGQVNSDLTVVELEDILAQIDTEIGVGKQVLEDSLCNWQKSPSKFLLFKG